MVQGDASSSDRGDASGVSAAAALWGGVLAFAAAVEVYGIRHPGGGHTFSEFTRWALRTRSRPGRVAFSIGWVAFSAWFLRHVTRESGRSVSSL